MILYDDDCDEVTLFVFASVFVVSLLYLIWDGVFGFEFLVCWTNSPSDPPVPASVCLSVFGMLTITMIAFSFP